MIIVAILFAFVTGFLGSYIATQKGRSGTEGFFIGFLFSLLGVVIVALLPTKFKKPIDPVIHKQTDPVNEETDLKQESKIIEKTAFLSASEKAQLKNKNTKSDKSDYMLLFGFIVISLVLILYAVEESSDDKIPETPQSETIVKKNDLDEKKIKPKPKTKAKPSVKQPEKENEINGLTAERDSEIFTTLNRLKDSMFINDISKKDIEMLEMSLIKALNVEYDIYDNLDNISSVVAKPHTEKYMREIGKFRAYLKYKEGVTARLSNDKIITDKIYFTRLSDENKFKNRIKSFREDIDYIKLKKNDNYDIDLRISSESTRIFSEPIYDTIIIGLPNTSFDKQKEFEVGGRVQLFFAVSKDLSKTKNIFGNWSLKTESPLLKSSNSQFKLLDSFIKVLTKNYNKLDLYELKNIIISEGININSINKFSLYKKRGSLSKDQFNNGLRIIEVITDDKKSTTIPVYINTETNKLIY